MVDMLTCMKDSYREAFASLSLQPCSRSLYRAVLLQRFPGDSAWDDCCSATSSRSSKVHSCSVAAEGPPVFCTLSMDYETGMAGISTSVCQGPARSKEWVEETLRLTHASLGKLARTELPGIRDTAATAAYIAESDHHVTDSYCDNCEDIVHRGRYTKGFSVFAFESHFVLTQTRCSLFWHHGDMGWRTEASLQMGAFAYSMWSVGSLRSYVVRPSTYAEFGGWLEQSVPASLLPWRHSSIQDREEAAAADNSRRRMLMAVGMSHVQRLGKDSPLRLLDKELLEMVMVHAFCTAAPLPAVCLLCNVQDALRAFVK